MQMSRIAGRARGWVKVVAATAIVTAALSLHAPAADAQLTKATTTGAIRLGVISPTNETTRNTFGKYYFVGALDYYFQQNGQTSRSMISVEYSEMSHNGNDLRIIPVTIGTESIGAARGEGVKVFAGFGMGAYFIHVKNPGNSNFGGSDTENSVSFGGYVNGGLDLSSNVFLDVRYHVIAPVKSVNTDHLELTAGVRF